MKSEIIKTASHTPDAGGVLDAISIADTGIGLSTATSGAVALRADKNSERDMAAYERTFFCIIGDVRTEYGVSDTIPQNSEIVRLKSEYADVLAKLKERGAALGIANVGDDFEYHDNTDELYASPDYMAREYVFDTASQRVSDANNDDIDNGLKLALGGVGVGIVRSAGIDLMTANNSAVNTATNTPSAQSGVATPPATSFSQQNSVQKQPITQEQKQEEIDELCEEFPDEPECAE